MTSRGRHRRRRFPRWVPVVGAVVGVVIAAAVGTAAYALVTAPVAPVAPGVPDRTATVARVIDGDQFVTGDGATVRVLAADACEMDTAAGPAGRADAAAVLTGATVELRREPGARNSSDSDGRQLRYVEVPGVGDLGQYMVVRPHTGAYVGFNDASPMYLDGLRVLDRDGRHCDVP